MRIISNRLIDSLSLNWLKPLSLDRGGSLVNVIIKKPRTLARGVSFPRKRESIESSFTLVELLLASLLSALVGLALVSTFSAGLKAFHRVQGYGGGQADILLSLEKMEKDLRNAFAFNAIVFEGDDHHVSFARLVNAPNKDLTMGEFIGNVTYTFDGSSGTITRKQQAYLQAKAPDIQQMALVKDMSLSYYFLDPATQQYGWQSSWAATGLPQAVKIEVTLKGQDDNAKLTRTVFLPGAS